MPNGPGRNLMPFCLTRRDRLFARFEVYCIMTTTRMLFVFSVILDLTTIIFISNGYLVVAPRVTQYIVFHRD
jgi:hypothetical protein